MKLRAYEKKKSYSGLWFGAQTIAIASGNINWYEQCVCKSTELRKHVCDGWVYVIAKYVNYDFSVGVQLLFSAYMDPTKCN